MDGKPSVETLGHDLLDTAAIADPFGRDPAKFTGLDIGPIRRARFSPVPMGDRADVARGARSHSDLYRANFVWAKDRAGTGYWSRNQHENLLVGVRSDVLAARPLRAMAKPDPSASPRALPEARRGEADDGR